VGETRVDLLHLLEDLRDAYPGSLEETIASEIVANSLDSRASTVVFTADPGGRTLCVVDDGQGRRSTECREKLTVELTAHHRHAVDYVVSWPRHNTHPFGSQRGSERARSVASPRLGKCGANAFQHWSKGLGPEES